MRYNFDFNELRNNRNALKNLYNNSNIEDKDEIRITIDMYNHMLGLANRKNNVYSEFDDTLKSTDINQLVNEFYSFYNKNTLPIINMILPAINTLKSFNPELLNIFGTADTNDDWITITLEFFKRMTTPHIYNQVKELFEKNKHFLNINYYNEYYAYPAATLIDGILKKKYIVLSKNNEVLDYPNLAHELFHYLFSDYDTKTLTEHNSFFLSEVEGMFANILFSEYFNYCFQNENDTDQDLMKKYFLLEFKSQVSELVIRNGLLDSLDKNKKIRLHKLNKHNAFYGLPTMEKEEDLIKYLNSPQDTNMTYSLSYLVALDLYYIYKHDREQAFYLIKCIRFLKEEDDIKSLLIRNDITFFEDNYRNLKDYIGFGERKIKKIEGKKNNE